MTVISEKKKTIVCVCVSKTIVVSAVWFNWNALYLRIRKSESETVTYKLFEFEQVT